MASNTYFPHSELATAIAGNDYQMAQRCVLEAATEGWTWARYSTADEAWEDYLRSGNGNLATDRDDLCACTPGEVEAWVRDCWTKAQASSLAAVLTRYQRTTLASRMAQGNADDLALLISEGQFHGLDHSDTACRDEGYTDWIAYVPSIQRASWVANGDAIWYDAMSLDEAVDLVTSGTDLTH